MARIRTSKIMTFLGILLKGLIVTISFPIPTTYMPIIGHCSLPDDSATIINLDGCGLAELPGQLKDYTNLRVIYARNNNIKYIDETLISDLKKLEELYMSNNKITLFPRISNPSIKRIDLSFNNIKNPIDPKLFEDMKNCKNVDLTGNGVCDEIQRLNRDANAKCKIKCSVYPWQTTSPPTLQPAEILTSSSSPTLSSRPPSTSPPSSSTSSSTTSTPMSSTTSPSPPSSSSPSTPLSKATSTPMLPGNQPGSGFSWWWIMSIVAFAVMSVGGWWIKKTYYSDGRAIKDASSECSGTSRSEDVNLL